MSVARSARSAGETESPSTVSIFSRMTPDALFRMLHKGLVFAVQVAHEMLGALGQLQHRLDADDLAGGCRHRGKLLRQQAQIPQMFTVGWAW